MQSFLLNLNDNYSISLFSIPHILMITAIILLVVLVISKKNIFKTLTEKQKRIIRYVFGIVLLFNLFIRRGSFIYYGVYDWHFHLDINFCNFTNIMFIIYSFSGNKRILNIAYHMAFVGPLLAIILPSYDLLPNSYSFYSFILIHHIIFIFSFVFIFIEDLKWEKALIYNTIEFLLIYNTIVFIFDKCYEVTYNFPLTFLNKSIINIPVINILSNNNIVVFAIYFLFVLGLLTLGNRVLKYITKKS